MADLRVELRKTKEETKEWTYEHMSRDLKVLSDWTQKRINETQEQNKENREHMERVIKEASEGIRNQLYDRLSNDLRRSMDETINAVERNGRDIKNLIMEMERTKERSQREIEKTKEEQLETWKQFPQTHQKWEQEQTSKKQPTRSEEERKAITIAELRGELTQMKKETQEWTYERLSKDLKVMAEWMKKLTDEKRTRQERRSQEGEYQQAVRQITEETRNQLYDRITNDVKISMFNVINAIQSRNQEIQREKDRYEEQRRNHEKRTNEMIQRSTETMVNQIMTMFKQEQEQMWKWIAARVSEMEQHVRPIHNRKYHWRYHRSPRRDQQSENGEGPTPIHERRSANQYGQRAPSEEVTGDDEPQEHKTHEEEERTDYNHWLAQIAKESFHTLDIHTLKEHDAALRSIFARITERHQEGTFLSPKFDQPEIRSRIRRAFSPKRSFTVTEEIVRSCRGIYVTTSDSRLIEVADERAGKHRAMTYLAKRLHIPAEGTAAFGDGDNDAEMLKAAGVGIAMENATALCREAADYVTLSHEKDGVAWGIRKILGL